MFSTISFEYTYSGSFRDVQVITGFVIESLQIFPIPVEIRRVQQIRTEIY